MSNTHTKFGWISSDGLGRDTVTDGRRQLQYSHRFFKQVAQWATIAHLGASIMFGDTLIYDAQRQVTLNLKQ